jgi:thymidylate synthase
MEIQGECLDHVLHQLYRELDRNGQPHSGRRGSTLELLGVAVRILKPRARISRSENRGRPFSALGELLWYLSGSDKLEFIQPYVPEYAKDAVDGKILGAYGPRILAMRGEIDQSASIEQLLTENPGSRRAVIQLFNAEDIALDLKEVPCTTTLQFHLRKGLLHMSVTLRSNDAYWGLPHDVFCFTMLQEMMARRLGVELGEYYHYVGSMHIYEDFLDTMREYVAEGVQRTIEMPVMPIGDPFAMVDRLLDVERRLRAGETLEAGREMGNPYWADIVRLLQVFWARQWATDYPRRLDELQAELASSSYRPYVDGRRHLTSRATGQQGEPYGEPNRGEDVAV